MEDQASSHNFLSVIFGIFGIFGIEICDRKNFRRKNFGRKNFRLKNIFSKNNFSRPKKILWKSQWKMKISKFRFFRRKIKISNFSLFIDFFIGKIVGLEKNIFRKFIFSIENFFDQNFSDENFFDHIFRVKKSKDSKNHT